MTPPRLPPQLGSVVWAKVEDANGFRKTRPAVVVATPSDATSSQPLPVAAITTRLSSPLPDDHVLLPWDPQGKARSGLRRKCAAVASWVAEVALNDVQQAVGFLPGAVYRGTVGQDRRSCLRPTRPRCGCGS